MFLQYFLNHNFQIILNNRTKNLGEITLLVPQAYSMCAISPLSFKWAQLVP